MTEKDKISKDNLSSEELLLNTHLGKYQLVILVSKLAKELKKKEENKKLGYLQLLELALREILVNKGIQKIDKKSK